MYRLHARVIVIMNSVMVIHNHCDFFSNVAEAIVNSQNWKLALRNHITMENGSETTPFRKLIQRMPGIEFVILCNFHHIATTDFTCI